MSGDNIGKPGRELPSKGDGERGPSYADVRYLLQELEREYQVRTQWIIDPANSTERWRGPLMWVRLRAYKPGSHGHGDAWSSGSFGGNAGSSTMPAAMVHACVDMAEELDRLLKAASEASA